jgi:hypothetical protein
VAGGDAALRAVHRAQKENSRRLSPAAFVRIDS